MPLNRSQSYPTLNRRSQNLTRSRSTGYLPDNRPDLPRFVNDFRQRSMSQRRIGAGLDPLTPSIRHTNVALPTEVASPDQMDREYQRFTEQLPPQFARYQGELFRYINPETGRPWVEENPILREEMERFRSELPQIREPPPMPVRRASPPPQPVEPISPPRFRIQRQRALPRDSMTPPPQIQMPVFRRKKGPAPPPPIPVPPLLPPTQPIQMPLIPPIRRKKDRAPPPPIPAPPPSPSPPPSPVDERDPMFIKMAESIKEENEGIEDFSGAYTMPDLLTDKNRINFEMMLEERDKYAQSYRNRISNYQPMTGLDRSERRFLEPQEGFIDRPTSGPAFASRKPAIRLEPSEKKYEKSLRKRINLTSGQRSQGLNQEQSQKVVKDILRRQQSIFDQTREKRQEKARRQSKLSRVQTFHRPIRSIAEVSEEESDSEDDEEDSDSEDE